MEGEYPSADAALPRRLLVVAPYDRVYPPHLLQGGGLPRENTGTVALAKGNRIVKVDLHCGVYIRAWYLESGPPLCSSGCTSCGQCR